MPRGLYHKWSNLKLTLDDYMAILNYHVDNFRPPRGIIQLFYSNGWRNKDIFFVTLLWKSVRMKLTLPKWELGSLLGLPKLQSLIAGVKTPRIKAFFISLESYQSVNVENGLIWTTMISATQVMPKRRAMSQTSSLISLTSDH